MHAATIAAGAVLHYLDLTSHTRTGHITRISRIEEDAAAEHAGFVAELGADALGYCVAGVELFTDSTEPLLSARCAQATQ